MKRQRIAQEQAMTRRNSYRMEQYYEADEDEPAFYKVVFELTSWMNNYTDKRFRAFYRQRMDDSSRLASMIERYWPGIKRYRKNSLASKLQKAVKYLMSLHPNIRWNVLNIRNLSILN